MTPPGEENRPLDSVSLLFNPNSQLVVKLGGLSIKDLTSPSFFPPLLLAQSWTFSGPIIGNDAFEVQASRFKVSDLQGRALFSADKNEVIVGAEILRLSGPGGIVVDGSLQTPLVRASPGSDLR
ncbi:unnamed protein product [Nezara viridula]|uniref:Uncharacterized protein n=1 Tax=Nezara viridula TaxID=85310 RepID=A0A9P0HAU0_NEZVI|nr:unnamed protein product [Nezara viridula]